MTLDDMKKQAEDIVTKAVNYISDYDAQGLMSVSRIIPQWCVDENTHQYVSQSYGMNRFFEWLSDFFLDRKDDKECFYINKVDPYLFCQISIDECVNHCGFLCVHYTPLSNFVTIEEVDLVFMFFIDSDRKLKNYFYLKPNICKGLIL